MTSRVPVRPDVILRRAVIWDLRLQARYGILTVAAVVTVLYALVLRAIPAMREETPAVLLIFSDPTMIGFLFTGVLILFERGQDTLQAVVVTPLSSAQYVWSKALSLSIVAVVSACAMGLASHGGGIQFLPLVVGVALSSVLFVFVGVVAVARVRTVNEYLLIVPIFLVPAMIPVLGVLEVVDSPLFYLLPTQASFVLLQAAFGDRAVGELIYAVLYLVGAVAIAFVWARRSFDEHIRLPGGAR